MPLHRAIYVSDAVGEAATSLLDLASMQQLLDEWPETGWEKHEIISRYRLKLMRGLSAGNFIRYVEDTNH